jgi:FkbM family methyltransferase
MKITHLPHLSQKQLRKQYFLKKVLKAYPIDLNYFLKPNDGISHHPLIGIKHDEEVSSAIIFLSQFLPDYFIDVGANIGLISLDVGSYFKKVICIEPNPIVCNILWTNTALNGNNFEIHEVGIGTFTEIIDLYIPKKNLGGAFILKTNELTKDELAQKDGFDSFDVQNYVMQKIQIESCSKFFSKHHIPEDKSIVIKIDIEGQDGQVIDSLIEIFKQHFISQKIAIVFESHNLDIPKRLESLLKTYDYEVLNPRIRTYPSMRSPLLRRLIKVFKGESRQLEYVPLNQGVHPVFRNFICAPQSFFKG